MSSAGDSRPSWIGRYLVLREDPQSLWIYDVAAAAIARPVEIVGQSQEADG